MQPVRVGIIEDDAGIRSVWSTVIDGGTETALAATFPSGEAALAGLPKPAVDLWLVDFSLPGMTGVEFIRRARFINPAFEFIVVTLNDNPVDILSAIKAGANGYLIKPFSSLQLLDAIKESRRGGAPMTPSVARLVLRAFREVQPGLPLSANLSARELQILTAMAGGSTNSQLADDLQLSERTVATHLHNIYRKLHVRNRTEAVALLAGVPQTPHAGAAQTLQRNHPS